MNGKRWIQEEIVGKGVGKDLRLFDFENSERRMGKGAFFNGESKGSDLESTCSGGEGIGKRSRVLVSSGSDSKVSSIRRRFVS